MQINFFSETIIMKFIRDHWYDIGIIFFIAVVIFLFGNYDRLTAYQFLMWCSLAFLFLHQLEEYRIAGTFPGMINTVVFKSAQPDRYPLNTNTSLIINVLEGWLLYFLAAYFSEKAVWLGITALMVSLGNIIAHSFLFNIKGKTFYNAGLITCWLLFAPCIFFFFKIANETKLANTLDYVIGISLGLILNFLGVFKLINLLADKNTKYIFPKRNLLFEDRMK